MKIVFTIIALFLLAGMALTSRDVRGWICRETGGDICINILPQPANNTTLINQSFQYSLDREKDYLEKNGGRQF